MIVIHVILARFGVSKIGTTGPTDTKICSAMILHVISAAIRRAAILHVIFAKISLIGPKNTKFYNLIVIHVISPGLVFEGQMINYSDSISIKLLMIFETVLMMAD
jgi:hypothetical protein